MLLVMIITRAIQTTHLGVCLIQYEIISRSTVSTNSGMTVSSSCAEKPAFIKANSI